MLRDSLYHSLLRMSILLVAAILVFESGLLSPVTTEIANDTHNYLANAIGINAGVAANDINVITAQLTAKETELNNREAALTEREIAVSLNSNSGQSTDTATYVLSILLFILLVLVIMNYFLDYLRAHEPRRA